MTEENGVRPSEKKTVRRVLKERLLPLCGYTLLFALLRIPPFICLYMVIRGGEDARLPVGAWAAFAVLLHAFLVIPARGFFRTRMAKELGERDEYAAYGEYLRFGLLRYARGLAWGVPFLFGGALYLYRMEAVSFAEQGLMFEAIARFFGFPQGSGLVAKGVILYFAMLFLLGLLFAWGWRRDLAADHLSVRGRRAAEVFAQGARVRRFGAARLRKHTLTQFLLSLPGLMLSAAVLLPYALENLRFSGNIAATWRSAKKLLTQCPPTDRLVLLGAVLLLVMLPLCVLRRLRSASVVRELTREEAESGHAAG